MANLAASARGCLVMQPVYRARVSRCIHTHKLFSDLSRRAAAFDDRAVRPAGKGVKKKAADSEKLPSALRGGGWPRGSAECKFHYFPAASVVIVVFSGGQKEDGQRLRVIAGQQHKSSIRM